MDSIIKEDPIAWAALSSCFIEGSPVSTYPIHFKQAKKRPSTVTVTAGLHTGLRSPHRLLPIMTPEKPVNTKWLPGPLRRLEHFKSLPLSLVLPKMAAMIKTVGIRSNVQLYRRYRIDFRMSSALALLTG